MLTPPNYCIQVALSINRATCCFDTSQSRSATAESRFRRASLAENEHKRQADHGNRSSTVSIPGRLTPIAVVIRRAATFAVTGITQPCARIASRFRRFLAHDLRKTRRRYRHSLQGRGAAFRKGLSACVCKSLIPSG
jgi:hypothetical protein